MMSLYIPFYIYYTELRIIIKEKITKIKKQTKQKYKQKNNKTNNQMEKLIGSGGDP